MTSDGSTPIVVYFIGTAGAGKSHLVGALADWYTQHGISVTTLNLDPGAEGLPYEPDIDVRDSIVLHEVMEEHGLGPNGAQVAACDMIALKLGDLQEELRSYRGDIVLVDTPGQVELFAFRQGGKIIVDELSPDRTVICYCMDPYLSRDATGFATQMMLAATAQLRFQHPLVTLLTKADAVEPEGLDMLRNWASDPQELELQIEGEGGSMATELSLHVSRMLGALHMGQNLVATSCDDGMGLDDLYAMIQSLAGETEDGTPEYDTFLGHGQEEG